MPMTQVKKGKALVSEVMRRLEEKTKPQRTKRTLVLTKDSYDLFERLCRKKGRYPSDVVDEFISLFIESSKN
jgi:predicted CopG family antitoxin